jgi:hypothetical protein
MPQATPIIASFNGGEFSPDVHGRVDIDKYYSGCLVAENFVILPSGAARSIPGTYYVATGKTAGKKVRMVEFAFSTIQTYILEFGDLYIRVYKDKGRIESPPSTPVEITTTYLEADLPQLIFRQSADVLYITHPSYPPKMLTRTSHTAWTLSNFVARNKDVSTSVEAMVITGITKANPAVVTVSALAASPTALANGDIVHISGVVGMTEVNNLFFTVANINTGAKTFQLSGIDSSAYTAYTSGGAAQCCLFGTTDNNPSCCEFYEQRLLFAATNTRPQAVWGSASADYDNFKLLSTDVSAGIEYTIPNRGKVDRIRWMIAQTDINLGTVGNIQKLGPSDDSGLSQTNVKASAQISIGCKAIDALLTNDSVVYVTKDGKQIREVYFDYLSDKYISPPDITLLANHIFKGDTLALSGIVDLAYQQNPISILWAVRKDGVLCGMTYEKTQKVYGWFRVVMDGAVESVAVISNDDQEDEVWISVKRTVGGVDYRFIEYFMPHDIYGQIEDSFFVEAGLTYDGGAAKTITGITKANPAVVTSASHGFTNGDKVWIKNVLGMTEINTTALTTAYEVANVAANTFELVGVNSTAYTAYTSGGTVQKVAAAVSGLGHLEGETVEVVIDGAHHAAVAVASGAITLTWYGNKIHAGLFTPRILAPMPIIAGAQDGTAHTRQKRVTKVSLHLVDTYGCIVATDPDDTTTYETVQFGAGTTPALFTGIKQDINLKGGHTPDAKIYIIQTLPLPIQVNAIVPKVTTYD